MAQRRTAPRKNAPRKAHSRRRVSVSMAFWVLFFIVLISLFFFLLPMVKKNLTLPHTVTAQPAQEPAAQEPKQPAQEPKPAAQEPKSSAQEPKPAVQEPKPAAETKPAAQPQAREPSAQPKPTPPTEPRAQQPPPAAQPAAPPQPAKPPEQPVTPARPTTPPPESKPPETRDRSVYFMRENGGDLTLTKTSRTLAVSDSPLIDCVNALLAGPNASEKNRGMVSFIPPNTRLLSARVVSNTVHLNFNEEFRYNTFGREGCEAQLKQIVWTATEFPNVHDVQIEIEGKTVDFLIEGVTIRRPIGR